MGVGPGEINMHDSKRSMHVIVEVQNAWRTFWDKRDKDMCNNFNKEHLVRCTRNKGHFGEHQHWGYHVNYSWSHLIRRPRTPRKVKH